MRAVIQRVKKSSVEIDGKIKSTIGKGLLLLIGVGDEDSKEDADWLCGKISKLRVFNDDNGIMNLSITEVNGELLSISQFTLHAKTKKGNRPSYIKAAKPDMAIPLYQYFNKKLEEETGVKVKTGEFGANMQVELINDGPVTIIIDTKNKE